MPARLDLTGKTYGYIKVIAPTDLREGSNVVYKCLCTACGNECYMSTRSLRSAKSKSCGCLHLSYLGDNVGKVVQNAGIKNGTNLSKLRSSKPQRNNHSGVRGVCWTGGQWEATLYYQGQRIRLYRGSNFDAAVEARKQGEQQRLQHALALQAEQEQEEKK